VAEAPKYEKKRLQCPCGELIEAQSEDELVDKANEHLATAHQDLAGSYTREQILFLAY
jgi:predicted small metal-binding protein